MFHYLLKGEINMYSPQKRQQITIKLEGEHIKDHTIDVEELGHFLINLQGLFTEYSKISIEKSYSILYLKEIREGSVELVLEGTPQYDLEKNNIFEKNYKEIINTIKKINEDPSTARIELSNSFKDVVSRFRVESKLKNVFTNALSVGLSNFEEGYTYLNPERKNIIEEWIEEDYRRGVQSKKGIIVRIKGDTPAKYFTIITDEGDSIKCYYKDEFENRIIDYFKKQPVKIEGDVGHKMKISEIREIFDIKPWNEVTFEKIGGYTLNYPLSINVTYDDDVWCLQSEEVNTVGCGLSYKEALKDFEKTFKEVVEIYTKEFTKEELDDKAKELRNTLLKILKVGSSK